MYTAIELAERGNRILQLEQQIAVLVDALEDGCEYHHLPLVNGWSHKLSTTGKVIRCRLSEKAQQALAQIGGE